MAISSKNFVFKRTSKEGDVLDYLDSDTWYPTNPDYKWNESSVPLPAAGYYGATSGRHTLAITLNSFIGRISVQATLASNPADEDWFNIKFCDSGLDYIEFTDSVVYNPMRDAMITEQGSTGTFAETVIGNFTYLRIIIERDYITPVPTDDQKNVVGKIAEALINF